MAKKDKSQGLGVNPKDSIHYGWDGQDNKTERGIRFASVNPSSGFYNVKDWIVNGFRVAFGIQWGDLGTPHEEALWFRYLGGGKNKAQLPDTKVRFSRDYGEDGKVHPHKEYVGLPAEQKAAIRDKVIPNMKDKLVEGKWVVSNDNVLFHKDQRGTGNTLSGLGKFGLRNNNNSGIYDVVDTYDFPSGVPIPDRNKGYELEIRDTVWTKDAKPGLYRKEKGPQPYTELDALRKKDAPGKGAGKVDKSPDHTPSRGMKF